MKAALLMVGSVFFFSTVLAQQNIETSSLVVKLRRIRSNVEDLESTDPVVTQKKNALRLSIGDMILRLDHANKSFPPSIGPAMDELVAESSKLARLSPDDQKKELDFLSGDLTVKFKDRTNTLGEEMYNDLVPVTVVWNKGEASPGKYRVRYAGQGYKFDPLNPGGNLGPITSPVKDSLLPGLYIVWLTKVSDFTVIETWKGEISPEKNNLIEFEVH
jgi:hypothetical protein